MLRFLHILLVAALLGPSVGRLIAVTQEVCAESRQDCCDPVAGCDASCEECACCAVPAVAIECAAPSVRLDAPCAPALVAAVVTPPPAPPSDILHVPRSV